MNSNSSFAAKILTTPLILFGNTLLMYEVVIGVLSVISYDASSHTTIFDDLLALSASMVLMAFCLYYEIVMLKYCLFSRYALIFSCTQFLCTAFFCE